MLYLLGVRTEWLHVVMIAAYTLVLEYPFDSVAQISPDAFEDALSRMESSGGR